MRKGILAIVLIAAPAVAAPAFGPADTAAIYKAAGFKVAGGKVSGGCDAADPNWPRSDYSIEAVDLSGDGKPEAILSESNVACYGGTETGFWILARNPDGSWRVLAQETGGTIVLKSRHNGWADVEYGGPGMQKQPVLRYNGKTYQ